MTVTVNGLEMAIIKAHLTFSVEVEPVIMRTVTLDDVVGAVVNYLTVNGVKVARHE